MTCYVLWCVESLNIHYLSFEEVQQNIKAVDDQHSCVDLTMIHELLILRLFSLEPVVANEQAGDKHIDIHCQRDHEMELLQLWIRGVDHELGHPVIQPREAVGLICCAHVIIHVVIYLVAQFNDVIFVFRVLLFVVDAFAYFREFLFRQLTILWLLWAFWSFLEALFKFRGRD